MNCTECHTPTWLVAWPMSSIFGVRWCPVGRHEVNERGIPEDSEAQW